MTDEIELISDGDGVAVIGEPAAIERFLASEGLPARELGLQQRLKPAVGAASGVFKAGAEISSNSGRWVKLTKQSAEMIKKYDLMTGSSATVSRAIVVQPKGREIKHVVEFVKHGSKLTSPALLTGVAGIMAQVAMQQAMDEITDYLATIDAKVDDLLRGQKDAALAEMIGVDFAIDEAMTIREQVGRVSDVTWSKVQSTSLIIGRTQAFALRQLDALAERLERKTDIDDLAETAKDAEATVQEWLAVLAHCFRLQDGIAVLELDRVLDAAPEDLEQHRLGLKVARENRLELISKSTERLIGRMAVAAGRANSKVLLNPINSPRVVRANNHVATKVVDFHGLLGIESGDQSLEARRWVHAAGDLKDKAIETGADGVGLGKRLGVGALGRARSVTNRMANGIAERTASRREGDETS